MLYLHHIRKGECQMETSETTEINVEATNILDTVATKVHYIRVPSIADVQEMMRQRLEHECASLQPLRKEMDKLASAYNRYVDLKGEIESRSKRIRRLMGVLGGEYLEATFDAADEPIASETNLQGHPSELRADLSLWRAVREYLLVAGEAKVGDVQGFLEAVNFGKCGRQAIESALRSHDSVFRVVKRGRDKYISLRKQTA
jgi:hypothetical protein